MFRVIANSLPNISFSQMKKHLIIFFLLYCFSTITLSAQEIAYPLIDQNYMKGSSAFFKVIKRNIKYPNEAKEKGIVGLSVATFSVNCEGNVSKVTFSNELGHGVEEETARVLETSNGGWKPCYISEGKTDVKIDLSIAFGLNGEYQYEKGDVVVIAYTEAKVLEDEELLDKLDKAIANEKYDKAYKWLKLLMMRYPTNQQYSDMKTALLSKIAD